MERDILKQLDAWKDSPYRKPLIVKRARQVGKTWALKEFGRTRYRNCVYVSLEEVAPGIPSEYAQFFEVTRDPRRIVANLSLAFGQPVDLAETLIVQVRRAGAVREALARLALPADPARPREQEVRVGPRPGGGAGAGIRGRRRMAEGRRPARARPPQQRGGNPLSACDDPSSFKAYCLDVGLLRRLSRLDSTAFSQDAALLSEFKGAFAENYVLQELLPQLDSTPRYWTNEKPKYEVDYLVRLGNEVVPVEVGAVESVDSPSLRYYARKHPGTPLRLRFSMRNLSLDGGVLNVPLYLAHRAVPLARGVLGRHGA